jgi:hypothetical protein
MVLRPLEVAALASALDGLDPDDMSLSSLQLGIAKRLSKELRSFKGSVMIVDEIFEPEETEEIPGPVLVQKTRAYQQFVNIAKEYIHK